MSYTLMCDEDRNNLSLYRTEIMNYNSFSREEIKKLIDDVYKYQYYCHAVYPGLTRNKDYFKSLLEHNIDYDIFDSNKISLTEHELNQLNDDFNSGKIFQELIKFPFEYTLVKTIKPYINNLIDFDNDYCKYKGLKYRPLFNNDKFKPLIYINKLLAIHYVIMDFPLNNNIIIPMQTMTYLQELKYSYLIIANSETNPDFGITGYVLRVQDILKINTKSDNNFIITAADFHELKKNAYSIPEFLVYLTYINKISVLDLNFNLKPTVSKNTYFNAYKLKECYDLIGAIMKLELLPDIKLGQVITDFIPDPKPQFLVQSNKDLEFGTYYFNKSAMNINSDLLKFRTYKNTIYLPSLIEANQHCMKFVPLTE